MAFELKKIIADI